MNLTLVDLFKAQWTQTIHDEWINSVLADRPDIDRVKLERVRSLMDINVPGGLVAGYETLIPFLTLPDPNDRHILAAAIHGHANIIVTYNLRDFPVNILQPHGIEALHPDGFVSHLINLDASRVAEAVKAQRANLQNPPQSAQQLLDTLERQGLTQTVAHLRLLTHLL